MESSNVIVKIISQEIAKSRAVNKRFSMRAFAKKVDLSPSVISEIISHKRVVTKKTAVKILKKLKYEDDAIFFLTANYNNRTKKISSMQKEKNFSEIDGNLYELLSHWRYFAILSLLETNHKEKSVSWIARKLSLTRKQTIQSLGLMYKLQLLNVSKEGKFSATGIQLTTSNDVANCAIRASHFEHLELAKSSLNSRDLNERDFSSLTMTFHKKKLPQAKKMITDFRRKFCSTFEIANNTEVYRLGIQFFQLSKEGV